jgi:hypothetical protein
MSAHAIALLLHLPFAIYHFILFEEFTQVLLDRDAM